MCVNEHDEVNLYFVLRKLGTFYYDHTQGGNSPYSGQINTTTSMTDAGGTGTTSGGTRRAGGETKPFSASMEYMIKY